MPQASGVLYTISMSRVDYNDPFCMYLSRGRPFFAMNQFKLARRPISVLADTELCDREVWRTICFTHDLHKENVGRGETSGWMKRYQIAC